MKSLGRGDLVWITDDASKLVRDELIATKGIVLSKIDTDWFRVYMSWNKKTRIADFPKHMLKKIEDANS